MTKLSFFTGTIAAFGRGPRQSRPDAYSQLARYDDHLLKDIGLTRLDVENLRGLR